MAEAIILINPKGEREYVEESQVQTALAKGYTTPAEGVRVSTAGGGASVGYSRPEDLSAALNTTQNAPLAPDYSEFQSSEEERVFGSALERGATFFRGAASVLTAGASDGGARTLDQRADAANPEERFAGEIVGLVGGGFTGAGAPGLSARLGARAGANVASRTGSRIAGMAVEGAIDNGTYGVLSGTVGKAFQDKPINFEAVMQGAISDALLGGAVGGGMGLVSKGAGKIADSLEGPKVEPRGAGMEIFRQSDLGTGRYAKDVDTASSRVSALERNADEQLDAGFRQLDARVGKATKEAEEKISKAEAAALEKVATVESQIADMELLRAKRTQNSQTLDEFAMDTRDSIGVISNDRTARKASLRLKKIEERLDKGMPGSVEDEVVTAGPFDPEALEREVSTLRQIRENVIGNSEGADDMIARANETMQRFDPDTAEYQSAARMAAEAITQRNLPPEVLQKYSDELVALNRGEYPTSIRWRNQLPGSEIPRHIEAAKARMPEGKDPAQWKAYWEREWEHAYQDLDDTLRINGLRADVREINGMKRVDKVRYDDLRHEVRRDNLYKKLDKLEQDAAGTPAALRAKLDEQIAFTRDQLADTLSRKQEKLRVALTEARGGLSDAQALAGRQASTVKFVDELISSASPQMAALRARGEALSKMVSQNLPGNATAADAVKRLTDANAYIDSVLFSSAGNRTLGETAAARLRTMNQSGMMRLADAADRASGAADELDQLLRLNGIDNGLGALPLSGDADRLSAVAELGAKVTPGGAPSAMSRAGQAISAIVQMKAMGGLFPLVNALTDKAAAIGSRVSRAAQKLFGDSKLQMAVRSIGKIPDLGIAVDAKDDEGRFTRQVQLLASSPNAGVRVGDTLAQLNGEAPGIVDRAQAKIQTDLKWLAANCPQSLDPRPGKPPAYNVVQKQEVRALAQGWTDPVSVMENIGRAHPLAVRTVEQVWPAQWMHYRMEIANILSSGGTLSPDAQRALGPYMGEIISPEYAPNHIAEMQMESQVDTAMANDPQASQANASQAHKIDVSGSKPPDPTAAQYFQSPRSIVNN